MFVPLLDPMHKSLFLHPSFGVEPVLLSHWSKLGNSKAFRLRCSANVRHYEDITSIGIDTHNDADTSLMLVQFSAACFMTVLSGDQISLAQSNTVK